MDPTISHLIAFSVGVLVTFFVASVAYVKIAALMTPRKESSSTETTSAHPKTSRKKWIQFPLILRPEFLPSFCKRHGLPEDCDVVVSMEAWQSRVDQASLLGRNSTLVGFSFVRRVLTEEQWGEVVLEMAAAGFTVGDKVTHNEQYEYVHWI